MHAATSKVENSVQGSSCKLKFVHGSSLKQLSLENGGRFISKMPLGSTLSVAALTKEPLSLAFLSIPFVHTVNSA